MLTVYDLFNDVYVDNNGVGGEILAVGSNILMSFITVPGGRIVMFYSITKWFLSLTPILNSPYELSSS